MKTNKLQQLMDGTQEALAKANASEYFQKLLKTVFRQFIIYAGEHDIDSFNIDVGLHHTTTETTMTYLRVDINELKKCALEVVF